MATTSKNVVTLLQAGWSKLPNSPNKLLAYEPATLSWYLVVDDSSPIIELIDEEGKVYLVEKSSCPGNYHLPVPLKMPPGFTRQHLYVCDDIIPANQFVYTDRQLYAYENILPILTTFYNLK